MTYFIGQLSFPSKSEAKQALDDVLQAHGIGETLMGPSEDLLRDALHYHPDLVCYSRDPRARIVVRATGESKGVPLKGFSLITPKGESIEFCAEECLVRHCHGKQVRFAMRSAIRYQVDAARQAGLGGICPLSGEVLTLGETEVHHSPTFDSVRRDFLEARGLRDADIQVEVLDVKGNFARLRDPALRQDWAEYHAAHTKLVLVSRLAHRRVHDLPSGLPVSPQVSRAL